LEPTVSVTKNGTFGVNQACQKQHLPKAEAVQLLFDAKSRRIGIRPVPVDTEHSYKLRAVKGGGFQITAISFLRHYELEHPKTKQYPATWDDAEKVLVIKLAAK
jgi:hypothetical protein